MSRSALSLSARPDVVNPPDDATPRDALAAALALAGARWGVFPVVIDDGRKRPIRRDWQSPANGRARSGYATDVATVNAWWGPGGTYEGAGVGIALRDAGAFAIDLDDAEAADGWAAMVEAGGGIAPTFTVYSTKGAKVIMRRDGSPVPLDANGNKPRVPTFAGCTDVVAGYVLAWAPGRRWEGSPAVVADCPAWLYAPLSAAYPPPAPRPAPSPAATATPSTTANAAMPWARSWDGGVVMARECSKLAAMPPDSGRNIALFNASRLLGGYAHIAPIIDRNGQGDLLAAARACGLDEREARATIESGWTCGRAVPLWPSVRADDRQLDDVDDVAAAAIRAEAVAALGELRPDMAELRGLHHRRRVSVVRVVGTLLATVAESGRRDVVANLDAVAMAADVGRKAIAHDAAIAAYAALGWTWQPGDAVERRAGRWTWGGGLSASRVHGTEPAVGRQDANTGVVMTESVAAAVATPVGAVPDVLPLALRRPVVTWKLDGTRWRVKRDPQMRAEAKAEAVATGARLSVVLSRMQAALGILEACGQWAAEALAVVRAAPNGATAEHVADSLGVSDRTARRVLGRMDARGILASKAAASTGGRPAMIYSYAPVADVLDAERAVGARIYAQAVEAATARADRLAEARAEAAATGDGLDVVLSRMRAEGGRRSAAERRAAKGGEMGIESDRLERWAAQTPVAAASLFVPIASPWAGGGVVVMALPKVLDDEGKARIQRAATDRAIAEWDRRRSAAEVRGLALHYYAESIRAVQAAARADLDAPAKAPAMTANAPRPDSTRRPRFGSFISLERAHALTMAAAS